MTHYVYGLIGASTLWPWNALITASVLAHRKLAGEPQLYAQFSSVVMTASTLAAFAANIVLAAKPSNYRRRVVYGELVVCAVFTALTALNAVASGSAWLALMIAVAVASSVGTALVQNGSMALAQEMQGSANSLWIMNGQAVAGVLPPLLAMAFNSSPAEWVAPLTFLSVSGLAALVLVLIYKVHREYISVHGGGEPAAPAAARSVHEYVQVFELAWAPFISVLLVFIVSLSYPVFANNVVSTHLGLKLFSPLTHLVWNLGDLVGRLLCSKPYLRVTSNVSLVSLALARVAIVAVLVVYVRAGLQHDWFYLTVMLAYGVTSGHLMSSAVVLTKKELTPSSQHVGSGVLVLMMSLGLMLGSGTSFITTALVW